MAELIRQVWVTEQTPVFVNSIRGLETDQIREFKQLEENSRRVKRLKVGGKLV